MTWKECKKLILEDLKRTTNNPSKVNAIRFMITNASFKMSFWFRIGTYLQGKRWWKLSYYLVFWHYKQLMYKTSIQLPLGTNVGGGLKFYHFGNVVINKNTTIGKNISIYNGVSIGINGQSFPPIIGDNVVICTGAKVIGNIIIGNNCVIGANSVVIRDIPENSVAVGVPARVLKNKGGYNYAQQFISHK